MIRIEFANNDNRGNQTTKAQAIQIGELSLFCTDLGRGAFCFYRFADGKFKLGRISCTAHRFQSWYGNMMWNACEIDVEQAAKIVNYLRTRSDWEITEGPSRIYDKWLTAEVFTNEDILACMK